MKTESITAALIAAALLGLWFTSTRLMSIAAFAALCFLYPPLVVIVIIGVALAFYYFKFQQRKKP